MYKTSLTSSKEELFSLICRYQPIARSDIAEIVGLTRASVSNMTKELIALHLIRESKKVGNGIGRKKVLLEVRDNGIHTIGINIGRRSIFVGLYDAAGRNLWKRVRSYTIIHTLQEYLSEVKELTTELINWAQDREINIDAIGVGIPGPVDSEHGIYRASHFLKYEVVNIKKIMEDEFSIPTYVERDVNAAVLGERFFGAGRRCETFAYLLIVEGIGAGIVLDGHLYRGAHGLAGKIGRLIFPKEQSKESTLSLEEMGSELSALKVAEEYAQKNKNGYLYKVLQQRPLHIDDILQAARKGDPTTMQVVDVMVHYASIAVANLVFLLDPKLIIISGDFIGIPTNFVGKVSEKVRKMLPDRPLPKLIGSHLYDLSISLGAATRALSETVSTKIRNTS